MRFQRNMFESKSKMNKYCETETDPKGTRYKFSSTFQAYYMSRLRPRCRGNTTTFNFNDDACSKRALFEQY